MEGPGLEVVVEPGPVVSPPLPLPSGRVGELQTSAPGHVDSHVVF